MLHATSDCFHHFGGHVKCLVEDKYQQFNVDLNFICTMYSTCKIQYKKAIKCVRHHTYYH